MAKRLTFYKLRAAVKIEDVSKSYIVAASLSRLSGGLPGDTAHIEMAIGNFADGVPVHCAMHFADPRHDELGERLLLLNCSEQVPFLSFPDRFVKATPAAYHAHRIALGVPEAGLDYVLGDTFPHEADFDIFHGADFDKGCFVGQEVVARMQHKTVVRKRVVKVAADAALPADHPDITAGPATIGRLGSVDGTHGLALLRPDRAIEAIDRGEPVRAGETALTVDAGALATYRAGALAKAETP